MNRKLKALGLALFAAFAMSAIGAQAASADLFTSADPDSTVLTSSADTEHVFSYSSGEVKCKVTKFSGTQTGETATELTITPTYEECTFGGEPAAVRTNHCDYKFTTETDEGHAPVGVECENKGEHIEVEIIPWNHCTLTIAPQTTGGGVTYTDEGGEVTVDITAEVEVTRDNPGSHLFCAFIAESGNGTYSGSSWMAGYEDEGGPSTSFTEDETATTDNRGITHWSWEEGSQVDIGADTG